MRRALWLTLFLSACAAPAFAQDAVKADSKHYKVEFENAQVRVLRVTYGPREKSNMHRHPNAIAIFVTDGRMKFNYPNGTSEEREGKAGQAIWTPATRHLPENMTDNNVEVILVEMKNRRRTPARKPAATTSPTQ